MYDYIKMKWYEREATELQVYMLVPMFLTQEEADAIVASPQKPLP